MNATKQAGLWDRIKRWWRGTGSPKRDFAGPTPSEDQVVSDFAEDFVQRVLWAQTTPFLRQVVLEANKAGLPHRYLPYVFMVLDLSYQDWPDMSPSMTRGLKIAVDLLRTQGELPNYRPALSLPPPEFEDAVDRVVQGLGLWSVTGLSAALIRGYASMLKKWSNQMARAVKDTLPADKAGMYLKLLFEEYLRQSPRHFLDGLLLERVLAALIR